MSKAKDPQIGRVLKATYRVERLLGRGGMGAVYEAHHTKISKRYAVKLLLPEVGLTPTMRERFFREAEACSRIDHENVVEILDFDETPDNELFMVMEMLQGKDLADRLRDSPHLPVDDVIRWFAEICNAVAAAHRLGIVHRDLKPGNVFIQQRSGRELVKVLDFGLAKFRAGAGLTTSGAMMGTPCYMAPEQIEGQGEAVGPATDVFALGCILYELLVGEVAFHGKSIAQIAYKIVHGERPQLAHGPYQSVQPVIAKCLATDPAERYQTVDELRLAFVTAMGEAEVVPGDLLETMAARADVGELPTMASGLPSDVTLPASTPPDATAPEMAVAATVAYSPSTVGMAESTLPPEPLEVRERDELPDAAMYTTTGRIKQRKWTLLTVALLLAGGVAGLLLLQSLRSDRGKQKPATKSPKALPAWASGLPKDVHPDLLLAEQPARWMTLTAARWAALATALEKANQPALGPDKLQRLQVRMYVARSRAHLLGARLKQAHEVATLALRKATDAGDPHARLLAANNAAWLHLQRGHPSRARKALSGTNAKDPRLLALRAAVNLAVDDVSTAQSQAADKAASPQDPTRWLVLSLAASRSGDRLMAERAAARALALAPQHPPARIRMATLLAGSPRERTTAIGLCQKRAEDPPLYTRALALCKVRLALITALDRSDAHTRRAVLIRVGDRLGDAELLASAPLLLAEPGLPRRVAARIARLLGAPPKAAGRHAKLLRAATALHLGKLPEAAALLAGRQTTTQKHFRARALRAEIALRAGKRKQAVALYRSALQRASQSGVRPAEGAKPKAPVPGACDRRAPRETDYYVMERRLAQLSRPPGNNDLTDGLGPVLAMVLRQEPVL